MQRGYARKRGFTLIELMIVVAIVAVLAAIALPSYQDYVRKGRRADGRSLLQGMSLAQEKWRLGHTTYGLEADLPSPTSTYYTMAVVAGSTATDYELTATAKAGTSQANDTGCTIIQFKVQAGVVSYLPDDSYKCWGK